MANIKTITLDGAEQAVTISGQNCCIQNMGTGTVYASAKPNVEAGADGVMAVTANNSVLLTDTRGTVYLLGSGTVQLAGTDYATQVFNPAPVGGGSGVSQEYVDAQDAAALDSAKSYADSMVLPIDGRVSAVESAVNMLNGTGAGSVSKAIADGIAEVVAGAPESLDTLKEISDWIESHSESAAAMNSEIKDNAAAISSLQATVASKADSTDIPTALPANGGDADTVNGHTVNSDVPANAKFTDTTYSAASATAAGLVSTAAQTFAGAKTFNGSVICSGASVLTTAQARNIYAGTADLTAGTSALATGAIYICYE